MKKSRALYLSLLFLAFLFVYFYGGRVPYVLFYTVLLLPVVSFLYTLLVYYRFTYVQELNSKFVTKGDRVNFLLRIYNEDFFLYPYVRIGMYGAETLFANQFQVKNFSLLPFKDRNYTLELQCNYRGYYEIGLSSVEIEDFLGLFTFRYKVFEPKCVTVYPRVVILDSFFLKTDFMSESHSILDTNNEDMATVSDVRSYTYGDSLKRIHWKLTAKENELMVKKYQSTSETSAIIMLDLHQSTFSADEGIIIEDKLIESIVAVLYYCLHNWIPVDLVYYSGELVNIHAKNHLMFNEIYDTLAKVKFKESIPIKDLLEVYINSSITKTNILIFTSNLDYELYNQIHKTSSSGYDVSLIYTSPEQLTGVKNQEVENILSFLPEIGVNVYRININDDIKSVLERQ